MTPVTLQQLPAYIQRRARQRVSAVVAAIRRTVATEGLRIVQEAVSNANPPPVDRGTYRRSFQSSPIPGGAELHNVAPHGAVVELGRRPGARMPPPAVLGEWARRKGLLRGIPKGSREAAQRSIGFVLARAIARRGIQGRRILTNTHAAVLQAVRAAVRQALKKVP